MRTTDLSLRVSQRKQACVLDPALLLAHAQGPAFALRLTRVLEPWLTRSFWQLIDASELLSRHGCVDATQDLGAPRMLPDASALADWISLRDNTDAGSWPLRWVGDNVAESQIGDDADADVVGRYEHLASALAQRVESKLAQCGRWRHGVDPRLSAMDTLALSATLDGALVLSVTPLSQAQDPWPVQAMTLAGLNALRLEPMSQDTLFAAERLWVRDALVSAGLAALAERLPQLAVLHVMVNVNTPPLPPAGLADAQLPDPWASAQGWWYPL